MGLDAMDDLFMNVVTNDMFNVCNVMFSLGGFFLLLFRMRGGAPLWPQNAPLQALQVENSVERSQNKATGRGSPLPTDPRAAGVVGSMVHGSDRGGRSRSVSIIVPARNESHNILPLLESLIRLHPPPLEVIVLDDQSEDDTFAKAKAFARRWAEAPRSSSESPFPIHVVKGAPRPQEASLTVKTESRDFTHNPSPHGAWNSPEAPDTNAAPRLWNGKQWACHQGAQMAKGDYLLFTDADTIHHPASLEAAVSFAERHNYDLISALPFHRCAAWWDRLLGPFQVWLLAMTNPFGHPTPHRLFAIGQYLLFQREGYFGCGGHRAVCNQLAEDIPLAQRVLNRRPEGYGVYSETALFEVQMYGSLGEFFRGWRRNFRAGFELTSPWLGCDAFLYISAITGSGNVFRELGPTLVALMTVILLMWQQRRLGRFSFLGPLLFPLSLAMFCAVSLCALFDKVCRRDQKWKGRHHSPLPEKRRKALGFIHGDIRHHCEPSE